MAFLRVVKSKLDFSPEQRCIDQLVKLLDLQMKSKTSTLWKSVKNAMCKRKSQVIIPFSELNVDCGLLTEEKRLEVTEKLLNRYRVPHCEFVEPKHEYFAFQLTLDSLVIQW